MSENLSKLKVIMIFTYYPPLTSGIGDYTACLSKELALRDVDVTVVAMQVPGVVDREVCGKVDIRRIVEGWYMSEVRTILAVMKEKGTNAIIHVQYPSKWYYRRPMINLLPAIVRLAMPRSPVVVTMHGFHEYRLLWRIRALPMVLAANARILVNLKDYEIVTRWLKPFNFLTELMPIGSSIPVVPVSSRIRAQLREQLGFNGDDAVIVFFGDMRPDKGFLEFLRAIRAIRSHGAAFRLLVISRLNDSEEAESLYCREVREALESSKAEKWASVVEAPEPEAVSRMLQLADLAVFPFPMGASENRSSLLAAIAHGLPTITTQGPSTPERFEEYYGVETVPAGDYIALAYRIDTLVRSPKLREELKRRVIEAPRFPSWGVVALNTIALYRRLLGDNMATIEGKK